MSRSNAIDALRGAAILSMLAANLAGPCLSAPHPLALRLFGSFAAPAFVLLAGMMTIRAGSARPLARLLKRALLLLGLGVVIDILCWGIAPFETVDVLYLLALALPCCGLCGRLPLAWHAAFAVAILAVAPALRGALGYGPLLPDQLAYPWPLWRRWLVDGWFPVFPWLGVALLGAVLGRTDWQGAAMRRKLAGLGIALVAVGGAGYALWPPSLVTRGGYSELFYPPSSPYLAISLGAVLLTLLLLHRLEARAKLTWLSMLGQASLELYVAHVALIALVLDEWLADLTLLPFGALYVGLALALSAGAWLLKRYRSRVTPGRGLDRGDRASGAPG